MDNYCDAWHSNEMHKFGIASNLLRGKLLGQEKYSCNNPFIVLCVETAATSQEDNHFRNKREEASLNGDEERNEDENM